MILELDALDKEDLKRRVPLATVCLALGIKFDNYGFALCPLHDDHKPSFSLFEAKDGSERWGCFPCGVTGDHYSLVRRVNGVNFSEAVRFVASLVGEGTPDPVVRTRVELDLEALIAYVYGAQRRAQRPENEGLLCVASDLRSEDLPLLDRVLADSVLRNIRWGVDDRCNIVMPHYSKSGQLTGAKIRAIGGAKWSFPGSRYEQLYGSWRTPKRSDACLVCEGETDYAHAVLDDVPAHVLSVPSGAKYRDEWLEQVSDFETVYLGFDPDDAGVKATSQWVSGLATVHVQTRVLQIPQGEDLKSCGISTRTLMETSVG